MSLFGQSEDGTCDSGSSSGKASWKKLSGCFRMHGEARGTGHIVLVLGLGVDLRFPAANRELSVSDFGFQSTLGKSITTPM
jgi:hypothetical protein